ncbi:MAG: alanine racemase [Polyangiaceae bacterium]|nr:alanine racemase [Polyangiaceae bacterium]
MPALTTPLPRVLRPQRAMPADAVRPTRADVNLAHLRHNLHVLRRAAGRAEVWSVLKADAYGHGSKAVARTLERAGATGLCVALLEEGIELREAGIRVPILVMGGYYGGATGELLRHDLTPVVHDPGTVAAIAEEVRYQQAEPVHVHLKVDTAMSRLGARPEDVGMVGKAIAAHPELVLDGLMTHFACADSGDLESVKSQLDLFDQAATTLARLNLRPRVRHAANSAALLRAERAVLDCVRPGIALFGVEPFPGLAAQLRPVMRIRTEIVSLRDIPTGQAVGYGGTWRAARPTRIATVPVGYADGLPRSMSNRGQLLVRGRRVPIVGLVSMDLTMIDVTDVPGVCLRDECVVLGSQRGPLGEDAISAAEIAAHLGSIPWEVLTNVSRRVPRFYREP